MLPCIVDAHIICASMEVGMAARSERKSANLSLDTKIVADARELGINISRAAAR